MFSTMRATCLSALIKIWQISKAATESDEKASRRSRNGRKRGERRGEGTEQGDKSVNGS